MTKIYHSPDNERMLDELYVFLSIDDKGRHGLVATWTSNGWAPLITGDANLLEPMKSDAREISRATGKRIGLFRFKRGEQMWLADDA